MTRLCSQRRGTVTLSDRQLAWLRTIIMEFMAGGLAEIRGGRSREFAPSTCLPGPCRRTKTSRCSVGVSLSASFPQIGAGNCDGDARQRWQK
jgi:hypothetical protein